MLRPYARPRAAALGVAAALLTAVLAVVLPLGLATFGPTSAADAAPACPAFDPQQAATAAVVFHGRVAGPAKTSSTGSAVTYPVAVQRALKGVVAGKVEVRFAAGPCQPKSLTPDEDYFFFVNPTGTQLVAGGATHGVHGYTDRLNAQLNRLLGGPSTPEPPALAFDPPAAGRPSSFTRVAAPGAALVIIGVLGLMVVRRLGRRAA